MRGHRGADAVGFLALRLIFGDAEFIFTGFVAQIVPCDANDILVRTFPPFVDVQPLPDLGKFFANGKRIVADDHPFSRKDVGKSNRGIVSSREPRHSRHINERAEFTRRKPLRREETVGQPPLPPFVGMYAVATYQILPGRQ